MVSLGTSSTTPRGNKKRRTRGCRGGKRQKKKRNLEGGIFNLSNVVFSENEHKVLELGLKFALDKNLNKFDVFIDFQKFIRKMNIKKFYAKNNSATEQAFEEFIHTTLRNNSVFNPKLTNNHFVEVFKSVVEQDFKKLKVRPSRRKKDVERGLELLENKKNIVIRSAYKGGGLVILNKSDYLDELNRLVSDTATYEKLKGNPSNKYKAKLKLLIKRAHQTGITNKKQTRFLVLESVSYIICPKFIRIH